MQWLVGNDDLHSALRAEVLKVAIEAEHAASELWQWLCKQKQNAIPEVLHGFRLRYFVAPVNRDGFWLDKDPAHSFYGFWITGSSSILVVWKVHAKEVIGWQVRHMPKRLCGKALCNTLRYGDKRDPHYRIGLECFPAYTGETGGRRLEMRWRLEALPDIREQSLWFIHQAHAGMEDLKEKK